LNNRRQSVGPKPDSRPRLEGARYKYLTSCSCLLTPPTPLPVGYNFTLCIPSATFCWVCVVYCPSINWFPVDSECLFFGRTATSWPLARSHCISIGSRLVQPHQQQRQQSTDDAANFIAALRHFMIRFGRGRIRIFVYLSVCQDATEHKVQ